MSAVCVPAPSFNSDCAVIQSLIAPQRVWTMIHQALSGGGGDARRERRTNQSVRVVVRCQSRGLGLKFTGRALSAFVALSTLTTRAASRGGGGCCHKKRSRSHEAKKPRLLMLQLNSDVTESFSASLQFFHTFYAQDGLDLCLLQNFIQNTPHNDNLKKLIASKTQINKQMEKLHAHKYPQLSAMKLKMEPWCYLFPLDILEMLSLLNWSPPAERSVELWTRWTRFGLKCLSIRGRAVDGARWSVINAKSQRHKLRELPEKPNIAIKN